MPAAPPRHPRRLATGTTASLRFHIERADSRPSSRTVDGVACGGL